MSCSERIRDVIEFAADRHDPLSIVDDEVAVAAAVDAVVAVDFGSGSSSDIAEKLEGLEPSLWCLGLNC